MVYSIVRIVSVHFFYTCVIRIVPRERSPHGISAELQIPFLAHVQTGRVDRLIPTDVRVDQPELVAVIGNRGTGQKRLDHMESVHQHGIAPTCHSRIVMIAQLYTHIENDIETVCDRQ